MPSRFLQQWRDYKRSILKLTASGNVKDLHLVPYSFASANVLRKLKNKKKRGKKPRFF